MPHSHLATATNIFWRLFEEDGHDPEPLYRDAGINPEALKQPGMRVRYTLVERIWRKAVEIIDDPCFGTITRELEIKRHWKPYWRIIFKMF